MNNFWQLSDGNVPSGSEEASFAKDFTVIPDGTQAKAKIKTIDLIDATQAYNKPCYEVVYKISDGTFASREVRQKIKCFDDKVGVSDRNLNMLKRLYDICNHKPTHKDAPTTKDLQPMIDKELGIKIREFIGTKQDGSPSNGNYVSEIFHANKDFETLVGVKLEVPLPMDSAMNRNPRVGNLPADDSGIPF